LIVRSDALLIFSVNVVPTSGLPTFKIRLEALNRRVRGGLPVPQSVFPRSSTSGGGTVVSALSSRHQQQHEEDGFSQDIQDAVENAFPVQGYDVTGFGNAPADGVKQPENE